ncbi:MAG: GAF domain-containing protein, partial [Pararheinheimera sp.]|nr:GAF domain-containing protein [Rheinheimera sp.]
YGVGSCGTAAYLGQRVIVEDVRVHPYWQPYQALVDIAGIRSCWSEPIKNRQGKVLDILNQNFPLCSFVTSPCYRMSSAANCYYSINIENISILVVN